MIRIDWSKLVHELVIRGLGTDALTQGPDKVGHSTVSRIKAGLAVRPVIVARISRTVGRHPKLEVAEAILA